MKKSILKNKMNDFKKILRDPILLFTIIAITLFLFTFILYPIAKVLLESFKSAEGGYTFQHVINSLSSTENRGVLWNTIKLGLVSSTLAVIVAFIFAYADAFVNVKFKKLFSIVSILPIISPPFALGMSFIMLFGQRGLITHKLLGIPNANIYGFKGLVAVQVLAFFPTAYLMLKGVLQQIDPSIDEASRNLGASRGQVFKTVIVPLIKPAALNAFMLVFIQSVADFGNVMVIGGNYNTLSAQVYMQSMGNYDLQTGTALASVLLSISISMYLFQKYYLDKRTYITMTGKPSRMRTLIDDNHIKWPIQVFCMLVSIFVVSLYVLIPLSSFVKLWGVDYTFTMQHFEYVFSLGTKFITGTTKYALIASILTGILAMIIAFIITRKRFVGRGAMEFISMLAMAVPGTVIGMGYILAFNTKPLLLTGTAAIIIINFIVRNIPTGVRSGIVSLEQIDPAIEEAAQDLGANSVKVFTSVTLPLIKSAFYNGLIYSFVKSMTGVSAVIFLISGRHNLLTPEIMSQVDSGRIGVASAYATILILIILIFIGVLNFAFKFMGVRDDDRIFES